MGEMRKSFCFAAWEQNGGGFYPLIAYYAVDFNGRDAKQSFAVVSDRFLDAFFSVILA